LDGETSSNTSDSMTDDEEIEKAKLRQVVDRAGSVLSDNMSDDSNWA